MGIGCKLKYTPPPKVIHTHVARGWRGRGKHLTFPIEGYGELHLMYDEKEGAWEIGALLGGEDCVFPRRYLANPENGVKLSVREAQEAALDYYVTTLVENVNHHIGKSLSRTTLEGHGIANTIFSWMGFYAYEKIVDLLCFKYLPTQKGLESETERRSGYVNKIMEWIRKHWDLVSKDGPYVEKKGDSE